MNTKQNEVKENLNVIKSMIEKTKTDAAESGSIFILWGWLVIAATILTYFFVYNEWYDRIGYIWFILMSLGVIGMIYLVKKGTKREKVKSYSSVALANLWISCGVSFLIVSFLGIPLKVVPLESLSIIMATIAGIGLFTTGGFLERNTQK